MNTNTQSPRRRPPLTIFHWRKSLRTSVHKEQIVLIIERTGWEPTTEHYRPWKNQKPEETARRGMGRRFYLLQWLSLLQGAHQDVSLCASCNRPRLQELRHQGVMRQICWGLPRSPRASSMIRRLQPAPVFYQGVPLGLHTTYHSHHHEQGGVGCEEASLPKEQET